jgi:predicted nucleic acid-binding protein
LSEPEPDSPEPATPVRAVLDSDIIFSRVLHELFGRIAFEYGYFDLCWSTELLDEATRVLVENKPMTPERAEQWVDYMRQAFPDGQTDISTLIDTVDLTQMTKDPNDHHVCALAVCAGAQYLFAHDAGYKAPGLAVHGVQLTSPDDFLVELFSEDAVGVAQLLERQLASWSQGTKTLQELLEAFHRADVPKFAAQAAQHFGIQLSP